MGRAGSALGRHDNDPVRESAAHYDFNNNSPSSHAAITHPAYAVQTVDWFSLRSLCAALLLAPAVMSTKRARRAHGDISRLIIVDLPTDEPKE